MGRERRRRSRRSSGTRSAAPAPQSNSSGAGTPPGPAAEAAPAPRPASLPAAPVQVRTDRVIARESETMISEVKRVGLVSAVCFGMLAALLVVDRLQ